MPKRVKYRKSQRGQIRGYSTRGSKIVFGEYGLKALESAWITARQIEASRLTLARSLKHGGKVWIRIFPDKSVTKKPAETRMGKGKGDPDHWVSVVRQGRIMVELGGVDANQAKESLRLAAGKFPIKTRIISRVHS